MNLCGQVNKLIQHIVINSSSLIWKITIGIALHPLRRRGRRRRWEFYLPSTVEEIPVDTFRASGGQGGPICTYRINSNIFFT